MTARHKEQPQHVLAFAPTFEPGFKAGGTIKSMVQLLDHLPSSIAVTLITSDRDLGDSVPYPGLSGRWIERDQHDIFYLNRRSPSQWLSLARSLQKRQFALINVNGLWSPEFTVVPLLATVLGFFATRRVLLTVHGMASPGAVGIKPRKKRTALRFWSPILKFADPVLHTTTATEDEDVRKLFPWARTAMQPNSWGDPPSASAATACDKARFVFVSRIARNKNLSLALNALQQVSAELDFDIFGPIEDQEYWEQCKNLIAQLPAKVRATHHGAIARENVRDTFKQYDAFIFPTLSENFGYVVSESLSVGCPVVSSAHTGWSDVLSSGGGTVVTSDTAEAWAREISIRASLSSAERSRRKTQALQSYAEWHRNQVGMSAVEAQLRLGWPRSGHNK